MHGAQGGDAFRSRFYTEGVTAFPEKLIDLTLFPKAGEKRPSEE